VKRITNLATIAFVLTTSALLLPGYIKQWRAPEPVDAAFYVNDLIEQRARVFDATGKFDRIPAGVTLQEVEFFACARSASGPREFGWRGARPVIWDCPVVFMTDAGRFFYAVRLEPSDDPIAKLSDEGYRTIGIDVLEARALLEGVGQLPRGG
jgi:hypothetical protein